MSHTYACCHYHAVFSTHRRQRWLDDTVRERVWSYLAGITREHKGQALRIGGIDDHVHMLFRLPPNLDPSKAIQLIKGGSSKWIHDTFPTMAEFKWQEGFGVFTVSYSGINRLTRYIDTQAEHHKTQTFEDEFIALLKKHGIDYDPRYVFD